MARVTVEDCIDIVPNRFDLVILAARRSRDLSSGARVTVERDNDKNPVIALREIEEKTIEPENLQEQIIKGFQRVFIEEDLSSAEESPESEDDAFSVFEDHDDEDGEADAEDEIEDSNENLASH